MIATADITTVQTKTGKTIADFHIPKWFIAREPRVVELVLRSESMDDKERQYWFNLVDVMKTPQLEKFKGILEKERGKLDEIEKKYEKKPKLDPKVAAEQAEELAKKRAAQRMKLQAAEAAHEEAEQVAEDAILSELENL